MAGQRAPLATQALLHQADQTQAEAGHRGLVRLKDGAELGQPAWPLVRPGEVGAGMDLHAVGGVLPQGDERLALVRLGDDGQR